MNIENTPKIHFILPGGGVRGAFQAGFLYKLFSKYRDYFTISKIDGTSVGSINGIVILSNEYELLKELWFNIHNLNDLFNNWSNSRLFNRIISYYQGFYNKGLFSTKKINNLLINNIQESWNKNNENIKKKFSCVVVNVDNAATEYIDGDHKNILEYVIASASPWVITNPKKINNCLYTDGCLLETYPIKYVDKTNADLTVIVGYDQEHFNFVPSKNSHLLEYLATLIDIARYNSNNTIKMKKLIESPDIIKLVNPMKISFIDFNSENIQYGFIQGTEFADTFYETYLSSNNTDL
tara:strand:- start:2539 stop:3423 length:885 start_codon:yes stop_codon:yes gene_type:complete